MARDIDLEEQYWVNVAPEEFEYGREYLLQRKPSWDLDQFTPVMEIPSTGNAHNIQTDTIAQSNYRVIERDEALQDKVAYGRSGHGYQSVIVPTDRQPAKEVVDIISALSDYPLLDEMDHSELEAEAEHEDWESWGRDEFREKTLAPAIVAYADAIDVELDEGDVRDELQDNDEIVDSIWSDLGGGEYTEHGSDSTHFDFKRVQRKIQNMDEDVLEAILEPALSLFGLGVPVHMRAPKF